MHYSLTRETQLRQIATRANIQMSTKPPSKRANLNPQKENMTTKTAREKPRKYQPALTHSTTNVTFK